MFVITNVIPISALSGIFATESRNNNKNDSSAVTRVLARI